MTGRGSNSGGSSIHRFDEAVVSEVLYHSLQPNRILSSDQPCVRFSRNMDEGVAGGDGISSNSTSSGQSASLLPYNLPLFSAFLAFALAQFLKLFTTWSIFFLWLSLSPCFLSVLTFVLRDLKLNFLFDGLLLDCGGLNIGFSMQPHFLA